VWRCLILGHHEKLAPSDCHATHRSRPRLNDRRYLKTRPSGQRPRRQFLLGGGCRRIPGGVCAKLNKPLATGPPPRTTTGDVHNGVTGVQALDWLAALSREKKAAILRSPSQPLPKVQWAIHQARWTGTFRGFLTRLPKALLEGRRHFGGRHQRLLDPVQELICIFLFGQRRAQQLHDHRGSKLLGEISSRAVP
jgi:hypothetical protein